MLYYECIWKRITNKDRSWERSDPRSYEQLSEPHSLNTENNTGENAEGKELKELDGGFIIIRELDKIKKQN